MDASLWDVLFIELEQSDSAKLPRREGDLTGLACVVYSSGKPTFAYTWPLIKGQTHFHEL